MEQNKFTKAKLSPENVIMKHWIFVRLSPQKAENLKKENLLKHLSFCGGVMERNGEI